MTSPDSSSTRQDHDHESHGHDDDVDHGHSDHGHSDHGHSDHGHSDHGHSSDGHHHGHHHHHHGDAERVSAVTALMRIVIGIAVVSLLLIYGSSFQVDEGHGVVVTQFGQPVFQTKEAGFYWKLPWPIHRVHTVDLRRKLYNTPYTETLTQDQTNIVVRTYVVWHVEEPTQYFQSVGTPQVAEEKLQSIVPAAKSDRVSKMPLSAFVSTNPENIRIEDLESDILTRSQAAAEKFGIKIDQVGVKRIAYPTMNLQAALKNMRAERRALSTTLRAQGETEAQIIRNEALATAAETLREGQQEAGRIRGDAEREAAQYYEEAQQLDPEFYRFWRSLQVARKTIGKDSTLVLRSDEGPFRTLFEPPDPPKAAPRKDTTLDEANDGTDPPASATGASAPDTEVSP